MSCNLCESDLIVYVGKKKEGKCRKHLIKWIYGSEKNYRAERKEMLKIRKEGFHDRVETIGKSKKGIQSWTRPDALKVKK